jgi:hypothetical protein
MQVLEPSTDEDYADGIVECHGFDAFEEAIGDGNVICLNAPCASHGVEQVTIHSQVASQPTRVVNVHNADMAMS